MLSIRTPSSIFVRIYGGLLLVISMVALSTYLLIQVVNDHRAAEYRESMATGFFRLVAVGDMSVLQEEDCNFVYEFMTALAAEKAKRRA